MRKQKIMVTVKHYMPDIKLTLPMRKRCFILNAVWEANYVSML